MVLRLTGLLFLFSLSCDRAPSEPEAPAQKVQRTQKQERKEAASTKPSSEQFRKPAGARVVAIGDLHGDFEATRRALRLAGAIDESDSWTGGGLVVVQTGDQLDRGAGEEEIVKFLQALKKEAKEAGGALYVLNGNHETMNVMGDFRYVTPQAMESFADWGPASPLAERLPVQVRARAAPFLPGGGMALVLAEQPLVIAVGDTVFAHGGVLPHHVDFGIDRLNEQTRSWMRGQSKRPPALVTDQEGPLWTRRYGAPVLGPDACRTLGQMLSKVGAKRLVVGHTVQERGMSEACDGRVFRIDVGLSAHYGERPVQVLELKGSVARILTEEPER